MRVDTRITTPSTGAAPRAGRAAASSAFSLAGTPAQAHAASTASAAPLAGLDAILTLQAGEDTPQERRRRSVTRGSELLDGLDRLKAALLGGRVATGELRAIAGRLADRSGSSGDPGLDDLVAQIELRAAVELAKLEAARGA